MDPVQAVKERELKRIITQRNGRTAIRQEVARFRNDDLGTRNRLLSLIEILTDAGVDSLDTTGKACPECGAILPPVMKTDMEGAEWLPAGVLLRDEAIHDRGLDERSMIHHGCGLLAVAVQRQ